MKQGTIKTTLTAFFTIIAVIPGLSIGLLGASAMNAMLEDEIMRMLVLLGTAREGQLHDILSGLEGRTIDFASDGEIRSSLRMIARDNSFAPSGALSVHLSQNKKVVDPDILGIIVFDARGRVAASTYGESIGSEALRDLYFNNAKTQPFITNAEQIGIFTKTLVAAAPVIDNETGALLGVVANIFKRDRLHKALSGITQLWRSTSDIHARGKALKTVETYLVDATGHLLAHPHEMDYSGRVEDFTNIVMENDLVRACTSDGKSFVGRYIDHDGKAVIGSAHCFPDYGWTLIVEVNERDAFAPLRGVYFGIGVMIALTIFFIIVLALLFAEHITKPIKTLRKGADIIGAGNLDYRVDVATGDELEQLSDAINAMAENLKMSRAELDKKVMEQTKEIMHKKVMLEERERAILNILDDVEHEKRRAQAFQARDEAVLASVAEGLVVVDARGKFLFFNGHAREILGVGPMDITPEQWPAAYGMYSLKDGKLIALNDFASFTKPMRGEVSVGEEILIKNAQRPDGVIVRINAAPVRMDGAVEGVVFTFIDVSKEKEIDKAKSEFVSLASHQLKAPLSVINWNIELLLSGDLGRMTAKQKEFLKKVYDSSRKMAGLVSALLNVSRIELGVLVVEPESTDMRMLMRTVIGGQKLNIDAKNIRLVENYAADLPAMQVDQKLISAVFENLVSNAVKYTPEHGTITVAMALRKKGG